MAETIVIYHGNCFDGFTAAWAAWQKFGDNAEYCSASYGDTPPDVADKNVIILDFSYKRPVLEKMANEAKSLIIIDHHKTAEADLKGFGCEMNTQVKFAEYWHAVGADEPDVYALPHQIFDMEKSGAMLAWEFFHGDKAAPLLVHYVQDRDLWKFRLPNSRAIHAYLASHAFNFMTWDRLALELNTSTNQVEARIAGDAILRKHDLDVQKIIDAATHTMTIGGQDVPVVNAPYFMASDVAGTLAKEAPFGATYIDMPNGRAFSLRSRGKKAVDVSEIAKAYGGGGHHNAAGFTMPLGWEGDE